MRIDEINAEVVSSIRELHQYKLDLKDGYNKAKETLYTEEQVREAMEFARGHSKMTDTQFIKQFKTK